jgi:hypothetical protein
MSNDHLLPALPEPKKLRRDEWPAVMIVRLRELMASSRIMSFKEIACQLCEDFPDRRMTRSAVIGKCRRISLEKDPSTTRRDYSKPSRGETVLPGRRVRQAKIKPLTEPAPRAFVVQHPEGVRNDSSLTYKYAGLHGFKQLSKEEIKFRKHGRLPDIIEAEPLTSRPVTECEQSACHWPTSSDIRCMEVCGAPAEIGAYCARHASVAYRVMPTAKRNAIYHRDNHEYQASRKRIG